MNLTEKPEVTQWPETHYVYIEKTGPFQQTAPQAWQELIKLMPEISAQNTVTGRMSLYKAPAQIYRAGLALSAEPKALPKGMQYTKFKGGAYHRFVLKGSYIELPQACGRVFDIVKEQKMATRDDFCIEHYVTDPMNTPEKENITEILIPIG